ncbi:hypothetical protein FQN54_004869 [Arachnomyces sp. PD_36]|nr:hypothetical protein FQN54_004869 [Arachnomyces sp. PD_36]
MALQSFKLDPQGDAFLVMDRLADSISVKDPGDFDAGPNIPNLFSHYKGENPQSDRPRWSHEMDMNALFCALAQENSAEIKLADKKDAGSSDLHQEPQPEPPSPRDDVDSPHEKTPPSDKGGKPLAATSRYIEFRVSSKHLRLACPYFERMLGNGWLEGHNLQSGASNRVSVSNCDLRAFLVVLNIVHGRTRKVPFDVSLDLLFEIAIIVNYYECFEAVEVYLPYWFHGLEPVPGSSSFDLIKWLCISWVFRKTNIFFRVTRILLRQGKGQLQHLNLPISKLVIDTIDGTRERAICRVYEILNETLWRLGGTELCCSFECDSAMLGTLVKELVNRRLLFQETTTPPFDGIRYSRLFESLLNIRSPDWSSYSDSEEHRLQHSGSQPCSLKNMITTPLWKLDRTVEGLSLQNFPLDGVKSRDESDLAARYDDALRGNSDL